MSVAGVKPSLAEEFREDALLQALETDIGVGSGYDTLDPTTDPPCAPTVHAIKLLRSSLFKKWQATSPKAEDKALLTFLEANYLAGQWEVPTAWSGLSSDKHARMFNRLKRELDVFLHDGAELLVNSYSDILSEGYTGPGSSIGASGQSFYAKFGSSLLTATSVDLYYMYRAYASLNPSWDDAESVRESQCGCVSVVDASVVSFAPKNVDTARLICTEPSLNMYYQLGLKTILEARMAKLWGVHMDDQPEINRELARRGSLDGSLATLDLSSASDLISYNLCRAVMPEWFIAILDKLRCRTVEVRDYGLRVDLGMLSTMGNGFTFPVMTMLLSCVIRAVYHELGVPIQDTRRFSALHGRSVNVPGNWAVFGDDLIVRSDVYDEVVAFLHALGLKVNEAKSFNSGPFRESCGHDYHRGLNIRGVYLKWMTSPQDLAVAINLFNEWTQRVGIPLRSTVAYLFRLFDRIGQPVRYVPYADPQDAGIRVPFAIARSRMSIRRPGRRWLYKVCYKAYRARPLQVRIEEGVVHTPRGHKRLIYNASSALLSFLRGEVRDGRISIRQTENGSLYRTQWRVTPNWDYMPPSYWVNPRSDWPRFDSAVHENLSEV
jgi:hypothetical protein